ncbi:MAG: AAA family ATPase [Armatimonadota bacterium]|nr:AAA family ATPase [Armatimonadota bacterium]
MSGKITVVVGHAAWNDLQLIGRVLEEAGIEILAVLSDAASLADQARSLGADCVLFSPTLPGMSPALIQELLLHEDYPIAAVGLIPAGSGYAAEYQRFGMKGFVTTPLDHVQAGRLPALIQDAVRVAREERAARTFAPITAQEALQILDRGGWQHQTVAVYSPKGGVGKTFIAANLACAFGILGQQPTLLIDADMSRANAHKLLGVNLEEGPKNLFTLYERVLTEGSRTGRYVVRSQTLQAQVVPWRGKLHFLPGIPKMHMAGLPEFVEDPQRTMDIFADLLREARGFYTFRVLDVGPDFNLPIHWAALTEADTVLVVLTPEVTAIDGVKDALPALERAFGSLQRFRLILNQFDERFGIHPKEVVKYLSEDGRQRCPPVFAALPYDPDGARISINTARPVVLEGKLSPLAEGIVKLAAMFYPPLEAVLRRKPARGAGLFGKFRGVFAE